MVKSYFKTDAHGTVPARLKSTALARKVNANVKPAQIPLRLPGLALAGEYQLVELICQLTLTYYFQLWCQGKGQHLRVSSFHQGAYE